MVGPALVACFRVENSPAISLFFRDRRDSDLQRLRFWKTQKRIAVHQTVMEKSWQSISNGQSGENDGFRQFVSGSIQYVALSDGVTVSASKSTEVFVRLSGRGRILWTGGAEDSRDHRALGLFLVPTLTSLDISGSIHGLRVELPSLTATPPARPLSDVLVGLLCRRAWHGPDAVAEAALSLAGLLVMEEVRQETD